jgi:hypothetical protein
MTRCLVPFGHGSLERPSAERCLDATGKNPAGCSERTESETGGAVEQSTFADREGATMLAASGAQF